MTCREKLKIEHPVHVAKKWFGGCNGCPKDYGYLPDPEYCVHFGDEELCIKCWDREIPETEEMKEEKEMKFYTKEELRHMVHSELSDVIIELQEKYKKFDDRLKDDHRILSLDIELKAEEIEKLKEESAHRGRSIEILDAKVAEKEEEIDVLRKKNESYGYSIINRNNRITELESMVSDLNRENGEIEKKVKIKDEQCDMLAATITDKTKEYDAKIAELNKVNEKLKVERDNLSETLTVVDDKIDEYETLIEEQRKTNKELEKKLADAERAHISARDCYYGRVKQCDELAVKVNELEDTIKLKDKDIKALQNRIDEQRKKIEDLENGNVLPYFIRKTLNADAWTNAVPPAVKSVEHPYCKSVPCSEAIKQLEKKMDEIPCIKLKKAKAVSADKFITSCWDDGTYKYIMEDIKRAQELYNKHCLCKWFLNDSSYDKTAEHIMNKYKALTNAGFTPEQAMSLIPMWSDE